MKPNTQGHPSEAGDRPLVLVVLPRIVHLIIQQDRALTPALFFMRRPSYALRRERLLQIVDLDELGLDPDVRLPAEVVLVARTGRRGTESPRGLAPELRTWRLAASALAILRLQEAHAAGRLTTPTVQARIEAIGREILPDIESVLQRELRLFDEDDLVRIYAEFITLHAELQTFAPKSLDTFFPALCARQEEIAALGRGDLAWDEILEATRPAGAALPQSAHQSKTEDADAEAEALVRALPAPRPKARKFEQLMERAAAIDGGNAVVRAIAYRRACRFAPDAERTAHAEGQACSVIDELVTRLQRALAFDPAGAAAWRQALLGLLRHSSQGFWSTNKRLLFDLQKLCLDSERESQAIDLFRAVRTLGRKPVRRSLPNQREILMCKHLRRASSRVAKASISAQQREALSALLHEATASAERQLRKRLRKRIARSLKEGLVPKNLMERVARDKLIEELLDHIVRSGHLSMGNVRDAISRNQLKLGDLRARELLTGDALLRADRRLNRLLDGVYRRGEFYLRGLQRLTSFGFGREKGRFVFQYFVLPFGAAFFALEAVGHLLEMVQGHPSFATRSTTIPGSWLQAFGHPGGDVEISNMIPAVVVVGLLFLGLIHAPAFRTVVWTGIKWAGRVLKYLLVVLPSGIMSLEWARAVLLSRLAKVLRRYLLAPLLPALILYGIATIFFDFKVISPWVVFMGLFTTLNLLLNSTFGRRIEAGLGTWVAGVWFQRGAQLFRSLFDLIMALFRSLIEFIERVLYAIDEWLLFKTGENQVTFWLKGILGSLWSVIAYVIRFCLTLLVEPQINPIKHFPVVTVSHKILLPTQPLLAAWMGTGGIHLMGNAMAQTVAGVIVFLTPGVIGFLVWELKSNWNLYAANQGTVLKPAIVGSHGESLSRLLKPGFHSGAIGKVYTRMRRTGRLTNPLRRLRAVAKCNEKLHHIEVGVRQFVDREMSSLLRRSEMVPGLQPEVADISLLPTTIHLRIAPGAVNGSREEMVPLHILFQCQQNWLVAKIVEPGWTAGLQPDQQAVVATALAGLYKLSGVDIVEEQLRGTLPVPGFAYHLRYADIDIWAGDPIENPVRYSLRTWGAIRPHPSGLARSLGFPTVTPKQLLFSERELPWDDWVSFWENEPFEVEPGDALDDARRLLPVDRPAT